MDEQQEWDRGENAQGRWERLNLSDFASPFCSDQHDQLLKFPIRDCFPPNDPTALLVLQFLTAWEDLATIDRFKEVLQQAEPQVAGDEIGTTRWRRGHFFLLRIRLGIIRNIFQDLIKKWSQKHQPQEVLISSLGSEVEASYKSLIACRNIHPKLFTILEKFRHKTMFHYDSGAIAIALGLMGERKGEIIFNPASESIEFIAATQVLDMIPAGPISREEVEEIHTAIDMVQSRFRTFVYQLLHAYMKQRGLLEKLRLG